VPAESATGHRDERKPHDRRRDARPGYASSDEREHARALATRSRDRHASTDRGPRLGRGGARLVPRAADEFGVEPEKVQGALVAIAPVVAARRRGRPGDRDRSRCSDPGRRSRGLAPAFGRSGGWALPTSVPLPRLPPGEPLGSSNGKRGRGRTMRAPCTWASTSRPTPMSPRIRGRLRHRGSGRDGGDEPERVEIEPGALAGVFAAPAWLRDLGVAVWLWSVSPCCSSARSGCCR
jgi:hypothetical protein